VAERGKLRVLVVDDDPTMASLLRSLLTAEGYDRIDWVTTGAAALERIGETDLILLDHHLPDTTGLELLPRLLARSDPPSVIMVTGEGTEELAASSLRLGADDYIAKGVRLAEMLPPIVERARRNRMLHATRAEVEQELIRAERLVAVGEMTVTLHHELNNPLMAALAEIDLLLAGEDVAPPVAQAIDRVRDALLRMRDIVKRAGELRRADASAYLTGLRMIDLTGSGDGTPAATGASRGRAVVYTPDRELFRAAALLLRHAGFSVDLAPSIEAAGAESRRFDVQLLVLDVSGVPQDPLEGFRPLKGRQYTLVAVVRGHPEPAKKAGADLVLTRPFDPATFTTEILRAMAARA
jgi:DNA-binding response OmpR family regulator